MQKAKYLLIIFFPVFIILGNFYYLTFNLNYYRKLFVRTGVYQNFGSREIVDLATINLLGYYRGQNQLDGNFYSIQAQSHLKDIKSILISAKVILAFITLILFTITTFALYKKQFYQLVNSLIVSSIITILTIAVLYISAQINFDISFNLLHKIIFNNNLWLFAQNDNLLKLFPPQFFIEFANQIAGRTLITSVIIMVASMILKSKLLDVPARQGI